MESKIQPKIHSQLLSNEKKSLEQYLEEFPVSTDVNSQVFLGGSCNPTKWRFETAIPLLSKAGISYFNPQVPAWNKEFKMIEEVAKQKCDKLLFVIDAETRALYSCLEIVDLAHRRNPKDMYVVINDMPNGTEIQGQVVGGRELRDIQVLRD